MIGKEGVPQCTKEDGTAIKVFDLPSKAVANDVEKEALKEARLHSSLVHPNIVQFLGISRDKNSVSIVQELMHCSLDNIIWPSVGDCHLSFAQSTQIAKQILQGLLFLHDNCVIHADIKPLNV